jgi:hypothetical protein
MSSKRGNHRKFKGIKGVLPLGCLPLWGREGVTLITAEECNLNMRIKK